MPDNETLEGTEPTTEPTIQGSEETEPTVPGSESTEPTIPGGSEETEPTVPGSEDTVPATTEPTVQGSDSDPDTSITETVASENSYYEITVDPTIEIEIPEYHPVETDKNVLRSLNQGPMGPQGPVKVNHCIMNQDAGFESVVRIYDHKFKDQLEQDDNTTDPTLEG